MKVVTFKLTEALAALLALSSRSVFDGIFNSTALNEREPAHRLAIAFGAAVKTRLKVFNRERVLRLLNKVEPERESDITFIAWRMKNQLRIDEFPRDTVEQLYARARVAIDEHGTKREEKTGSPPIRAAG